MLKTHGMPMKAQPREGPSDALKDSTHSAYVP